MTTNLELNAVDMSTYGGELTATEAECMADAGVKLIIAGAGHPNSLGKWTEKQAEAASKAGLLIDGYRWLRLTEPIAPQMENAFSSMGNMLPKVRMWWIDCEDTNLGDMTPPQVVAAIQEAVAFCAKKKVKHGIYTGRWWWPKTGDSIAFAHLPLWAAYYDENWDGLPYGGWAQSAIHQYKGTTDLCGQSVDLNYAKNLVVAEEPADVRDLAARLATLEDTSESQWRAFHMRQDLHYLATGKWSEVETSHKLLSLADFVPKR